MLHTFAAAVPSHDCQGPTCWRLQVMICTLLTYSAVLCTPQLHSEREWQSLTLLLWPRCFLGHLGPCDTLPRSFSVGCAPAGATRVGICRSARAWGHLGCEGGWGD